MKIKYNVIRDFDGEESATKCPYRKDGVMVGSKSCSLCSFFGRPHIFSNAITCNHAKAEKRGEIKND